MSPRVVARVEALLEAGRRKQAVRGPSLLESAGELLRNQLRSPILRHAIAALRRGNSEAAFALLREAVAEQPEQSESTQLLWEVALTLGRAADAAPPMARLFRQEVAQGQVELGADHFCMLAESAPETVVDTASLVRIVPVLRTRLNAARGEKAQGEARTLLCDALHRCVDPAGGALTPPLALRIFEEARGLEMDVARRAAQIALESTSLHEAKRARIQEMLAQLEQGEWPEGSEVTPAVAEAVMRAGATPEAPADPVAVPAPAARARPAPAKPAAATPQAAKPAPKPAAAKPAPAKPAAAKPAPKPAPAAARSPVIPEEKGPTSGRKTVALTQDEIEAASTRLAERMAARQKSAAPAAASAEKPAPPVTVAAPPSADPEATFIGVAAPAPAAEPEEEALGTITAEPLPEEGEQFAIGGDLIEDDEGADSPLEVEPEDEDFALGITDMGPVLETDEDPPAYASAPAAAAEPQLVAEAEAAPAVPVADDADDVDFAIGIQDDAEAALTPEPAAELTPEPEPVSEPDVDDVIDVAFSKTFDQELTPEPELVAEAEFAPDSEPEFATPIDDEKPDAEAVLAEEEEESGLAEVVGEALDAPAASAPSLRAIDITPVELGPDGLVAFEVAQSQRTRIDYRAIEAVSVAEVAGLADAPVMLVYLVLRARAGRPRSALRLRCDAFDPGLLYPDRTNDGQALHAMLAELLERTRALPLPDPDSALGLRPQQFDRIGDFEAAIVARLPD